MAGSTRGADAEHRAEQFLRRQGLRLVQRNFRCKAGEIDLIMAHGDTLVFVEVRLRNNRHFASALESITTAKQQRIIRAARYYLLQQQLTDKVPCRFDVVALTDVDIDAEWIRDAFQTQ